MTWIAFSDRSYEVPARNCWKPGNSEHTKLLVRGSIVIDFDFSVRQKAPCRLVSYASDRGWKRRFTVYLNADHSLSLEVQQGPGRCYARLSNASLCEAGEVRLTYGWDAPRQFGLLSLESADEGRIHQVAVQAPIPMPLDDAISIVDELQHDASDERTRGIAVADTVVPVGPAASIAKSAEVDTPNGPRAIEKLRPGDMVLTKQAGAKSVRWTIQQNLPAMGPSAPIRLRTPFFGLSRDLIVAGSQQLLISGSETEYNFGHEAVLIEAKNLIGHPATALVSGPAAVTYYQLLLDKHDFICVAGAWISSLHVGKLAKSPAIAATTTLADVPASIMPVHKSQAFQALRGYETQALLEALTG